MMKNKFDIDRLAKLSKIELTPEEKAKFQPELERFLEFAKCMDKYNSKENTGTITGNTLPFNDDVSRESLGHEQVLKSSEHCHTNYFKLPRVVKK